MTTIKATCPGCGEVDLTAGLVYSQRVLLALVDAGRWHRHAGQRADVAAGAADRKGQLTERSGAR